MAGALALGGEAMGAGLVQPGKRWLQRQLPRTCGKVREKMESGFSAEHGGRTRDDKHQVKQKRFR